MVDQEVLAQEGEKLKLDETAEFKKAMALYRKQLLISQVSAKKLAGQGTPNEAKAYYEAHQQDFSNDRVYIQHILLKDEKGAKEIARQAKDPSNDFQVLAEKYSVDTSAKNNRGNVGWIFRGTMAPEVTEAAFSAKEGSITGPVKSSFGYHVIKVIEKQIGKPLDYNEVELQVQNTLRAKLLRNTIDQLRAHAQIKVDNNALDKM
jgi:peptidyl-prolyl cis-trans isomerase C